jgi:hypothetical protein
VAPALRGDGSSTRVSQAASASTNAAVHPAHPRCRLLMFSLVAAPAAAKRSVQKPGAAVGRIATIPRMHGLPSSGRPARTRLATLVLACAASALAAPALAAGCGSTVKLDPEGEDGGGGSGAAGGNGGTAAGGTGNGGLDGGADAFDEYVDPGCPDAGPPIELFDCDPYDQYNGDCGPGEGCYIYVEYPTEACGQEIYGAVCVPAGTGEQGDPCDGPQGCAPGFACVVSGSGIQCVQLCSLSGNDGCPPGFVCDPIDVEGFGGCL